MMLVANVLIIKYTINNIDAWTTERTLLFWCRVIEWIGSYEYVNVGLVLVIYLYC